jgi:predicted small secreted protein
MKKKLLLTLLVLAALVLATGGWVVQGLRPRTA